MMPEPGFQKPMPYLEPAEDRKSYTSLFTCGEGDGEGQPGW